MSASWRNRQPPNDVDVERQPENAERSHYSDLPFQRDLTRTRLFCRWSSGDSRLAQRLSAENDDSDENRARCRRKVEAAPPISHGSFHCAGRGARGLGQRLCQTMELG